MARRPSLIVALAACALILGGCGPPEARPPNFFELEPTKQCFGERDLRTSTNPNDLGFIIATAANGGLRVWFPDNSVLIGFAQDDKGAAAMIKGFVQVTPNKKRARSLLEPRGNVVINWITEPTRREIDVVHNCLK